MISLMEYVVVDILLGEFYLGQYLLQRRWHDTQRKGHYAGTAHIDITIRARVAVLICLLFDRCRGIGMATTAHGHDELVSPAAIRAVRQTVDA